MSASESKRAGLVPFLFCKCPRCGKGRIFKYPFLKLSKFTATEPECSVCHLDYQPETGFYFGAMYWSYALIVALIITLSVIFSMLDLLDIAVYIIPAAILLMLPLIFRYSRVLMLYMVYPMMYKGKFWERK